jgi:hypothetical protein
MPLPHLNVNLPTIDPLLDQKPWTGDFVHGHEPETPQPNKATLVFYEGCKLMLIAVRIMDAVLVPNII